MIWDMVRSWRMSKAERGNLMTHSKPVRVYRWIVFLLAAGYVIRMFVLGGWDEFAGPLRFLTNWALLLSFVSASRMMALIEGRSTRRWDSLVCTTAVVNAMVVFLYWRLYFADPTSVTSNGELGAWHLEMYLHLLGPVLQIIDSIFVHRSYRKLGKTALLLVGVVVTYVLWMELFVQRFVDTPAGSVTSGLPYRFLNNQELSERMVFYAANIVVALVFLAVFAAIAWGFKRLFPAPEAP